jgi:hypothetical protein
MNRVNKKTLCLQKYRDHALGLGVSISSVDLYCEVFLELAETFRSPQLVGIGVRYAKSGIFLIPIFEVWHRGISSVHQPAVCAYIRAGFDPQYPTASRDLKINKIIPPVKEGVVYLIRWERSSCEEEIDSGFYFMPSGIINEAEKRFTKGETFQHIDLMRFKPPSCSNLLGRGWFFITIYMI